MKVFNFTNGTKGELLAEIPLQNSSDGWLVEKNGKVYRVQLANSNYEWTKSATHGVWENGKFTGEKEIRAEDFGVGAICFCWGKTSHDNKWHWSVIGTPEWNREACRNGILTYELLNEKAAA